MSQPNHTYQAILIAGPTGSGKTPLGEALMNSNLWNNNFFHFDFGSELRYISSNTLHTNDFTKKEIEFIHDVLHKNKLIENEMFYIANKIFMSFISRIPVSLNDIIILNGLPRHIEQAQKVDLLVCIKGVIYLQCSSDTVLARISYNSGGDRTYRNDDSIKEINNKLAIFQNRTVPLFEYYAKKGIPIFTYKTNVNTKPDDIIEALENDHTSFLRSRQ